MPEVVDIVPKDIHVLVEIKVSELKLLKQAMDMCQVNMVQGDDAIKAEQYFTKEFYPFVDKLLKKLEGEAE